MLNKSLVLPLLFSTLFLTSNAATGATKPRPLACHKKYLKRCLIRLDLPAHLKDKVLGEELILSFYHEGRIAYKSRQYSVKSFTSLSPQDKIAVVLKARGHWYIKGKARREALRKSRSLVAEVRSLRPLSQAKAVSKTTLSAPLAEQSPAPMIVPVMAGQQPLTPPAQPAQNQVILNLHPEAVKQAGASEIKSPAEASPQIGILAKLGSANSPTGHMGVSLETYPFENGFVNLGAGRYDSKAYLNHEYGKVQYRNLSVGTGYLIGSRDRSLSFSLAYVRIQEKTKRATGAEPLFNGKGVKKNGDKIYAGLTPSLGMRFGAGEAGMFTLDYGAFLAHGSDYKDSYGANLFKSGKSGPVKSKRDSFSFGLGLTF